MAKDTPTSRASRPDPLSVLWHVLAAPQTLMVLLGLLVLTLTLASLLPQIPLSARSDPLQWLATQPGLTRLGLVRSLRLFDLTHSLWLYLLLALLTVVFLVRLAEAVELAWRSTGPARWTATSFRFWSEGTVDEQTSTLAPTDAVDQVRQQLPGRAWRWSRVADAPVVTHVAGRRAWALWARPVACVGFLAALLGILLLLTLGWRSEVWQPQLEEDRAVGPGGATTIRLDAFDLQRDSSGSVVAATSQVSFRGGETNFGPFSLSAGHPAAFHGVAVRQLGYLPVLSIRGWDAEGYPLLLQGEDTGPGLPSDVEVVFPDPQARPILFLEQPDRLLVLSFEPARRGGKPALHLGLAPSASSQPVSIGTLYESGSVAFDGSRLEVDLGFRPVLRADHLPGALLAALGLALALIALAIGWLAGPALAWIAAAPDDTGGIRLHIALIPAFPAAQPSPQLLHPGNPVYSRLHSAARLAFLLLAAGLLAGAVWGWRTTGALAGHAVRPGWLAAGALLAAMSLLAWHLKQRPAAWAAILAALSTAAVLIGLLA
jgi:hypothetical protein